MFFRDLETDRLFLKKLTLSDAQFLYDCIHAPEIGRYVTNVDPFNDIEEAREFTRHLIDMEDHHRWVMIRKSDGQKLGSCGVYHWNEEEEFGKLVFEQFKRFWGNGYMMEAADAVLNFLHNYTAIRKMEIEVYKDNIHSIELAKRLGFEKTDRIKIYPYRGNDRIHEVYEYIDF